MNRARKFVIFSILFLFATVGFVMGVFSFGFFKSWNGSMRNNELNTLVRDLFKDPHSWNEVLKHELVDAPPEWFFTLIEVRQYGHLFKFLHNNSDINPNDNIESLEFAVFSGEPHSPSMLAYARHMIREKKFYVAEHFIDLATKWGPESAIKVNDDSYVFRGMIDYLRLALSFYDLGDINNAARVFEKYLKADIKSFDLDKLREEIGYVLKENSYDISSRKLDGFISALRQKIDE